MMRNMDKSQRILDLARANGVLRSRDLTGHGIPRQYMARLLEQSALLRIDRGLYVLPDAPITEHHTLVEASKRAPGAIVCLLTALRFHGLTTANGRVFQRHHWAAGGPWKSG